MVMWQNFPPAIMYFILGKSYSCEALLVANTTFMVFFFFFHLMDFVCNEWDSSVLTHILALLSHILGKYMN